MSPLFCFCAISKPRSEEQLEENFGRKPNGRGSGPDTLNEYFSTEVRLAVSFFTPSPVCYLRTLLIDTYHICSNSCRSYLCVSANLQKIFVTKFL